MRVNELAAARAAHRIGISPDVVFAMDGLMVSRFIFEAILDLITLVFGHNDLLAANFLDDGQRLWLIHWDYAGFNSSWFDLANLSSNNGFDAMRDDQPWELLLGRSNRWTGSASVPVADGLMLPRGHANGAGNARNNRAHGVLDSATSSSEERLRHGHVHSLGRVHRLGDVQIPRERA